MQIIDTELIEFSIFPSYRTSVGHRSAFDFDCSIGLGSLSFVSTTDVFCTTWAIRWGLLWELKVTIYRPLEWLKDRRIEVKPIGFAIKQRDLFKMGVLFQILFIRFAFRINTHYGFSAVENFHYY